MGEVKLLSFKYFLGAAPVGGKSNDYSGSITLNPDHHSVFDNDFRYRAFLKKDDEGNFRIVAQCYVGNKCFEKTDPEIIQEFDFEGSDEGVEKAKKWLQSAYEAVMKEQK